MKDIKIIDNFINDMEFRNYIHGRLYRSEEYSEPEIDDVTLSDDDKVNDNDIVVMQDGRMYTVQTFLNKDITLKQLKETKADIDKEKADGGIVITNRGYGDDVAIFADQNNILIWDRSELINLIENKK